MRIGIDTNVLVYSHNKEAADQPAVSQRLARSLNEDEVILVPWVVHEFLHVLTDRRRFPDGPDMGEAVDVVAAYLSHPSTTLVSTDDEALTVALLALHRYRLGRTRLTDTLIAATLLTNGVTALMTCDPRGFAAFDGLELIDPRIAS